jgi:hypothetical protein
MVLDYKDVAFSFQKRKTRRRRQRARLALLVIAAFAVFCGYRFLQARAAVGKIQDLLLSGQVDAAGKKMDASASAIFLRASFRELRALGDLFKGRLPQAQAQFDELGHKGSATSLNSGRLQKYFFDRGDYVKLKIYNEYLLPRGGDENTWYRALVQAAFFNGGESERAVAGLSPAFQKRNAKALALLAAVQADLRRGRFDCIFDRNGSTLAYFDVARRRTRSLLPGLDFVDFDRQLRNGLSYFRLTLDAGLQKQIARLFENFSGTLLLLDLPQSSIAAAYSKSRSARGGNAVFSETYEPGAIVKIVTLLAYLRLADSKLFPYDCPGRMVIGGSIFYDRTAHRQVKDPAAALALSCNLGFARMGLHVGRPRLDAMLELFHFNSRPFQDWFLKFQTGSFDRKAGNELALASLAVGHGAISLTTVHAAVLAAVCSQNGLLFPPYLIEDAKSILDLGYHSHRAQPLRLLTDDLNFRQVRKAMQAVVDDEDGTGRRAGTAGLAVKTGSSPDGRGGFDALVIGFFPAEKPRYAFAFRLEGAGRAELNGMIFLRDLVAILPPE